MLDYIVVGFGLAGMHIAHHLEKANKNFVIYDQGFQNASEVSGGLMNPLILKRYTKAWQAEEFIPKALETYKDFENKLNIEIINPTPLYRKLRNAGEQNEWFVKSDKPTLEAYMCHKLEKLPQLYSKFGFGKVKQAFIIDIKFLIKTYKTHLQEKNSFIEESFDYNKLKIEKEQVTYKTHKAKKILFCEGSQALKNPYFRYLPLIGNKGEFLIIHSEKLNLDSVIKSAYALIPLGENLYKFGATFSHEYPTEEPEEKNKIDLEQKLNELIDQPYTIKKTVTGIRPTVLDRKPLLGFHPKHKNLIICNGFGTHGIMMASSMTELLIHHELHGAPLPDRLNIKRYRDRFEINS